MILFSLNLWDVGLRNLRFFGAPRRLDDQEALKLIQSSARSCCRPEYRKAIELLLTKRLGVQVKIPDPYFGAVAYVRDGYQIIVPVFDHGKTRGVNVEDMDPRRLSRCRIIGFQLHTAKVPKSTRTHAA